MAEFFNQDDNRTMIKDIEVENDFARFNPNITLGNIMHHQEQERKILVNNLPEFKPFDNALNSAESFNDKQFKKQVDKTKELTKERVKLFMATFLLITLIITGFVIYNLVAMTILNSKIEQNKVKISDLNKAIDKVNEQEETLSVNNIILPEDLNNIL